MRIRVIALLLSTVLALGVLGAGCGKDNNSNDTIYTSAADEWLSVDENGEAVEDGASKRIINDVDPERIAATLQKEDYPAYSTAGIRGVSVVSNGKVLYKLNYTPQSISEKYLCWNMVEPYGYTALIDDTVITETLDNLQNFGIRGGSTNENLAKLTGDTYITFNYVEDTAENNASMVEAEYTLTILVGEKTSQGYRCALQTSPEVYFYVKADYVEGIMNKTAFDMIRKSPYIIDYKSLEKVTVKYGRKSKKLYHDSDNGSYRIGMKDVEDSEFEDMIELLSSPTIYGVVENLPTGEEAENRKAVLSIDYTKSKDRGTVSIRIYEDEDGDYSISVDGEENFYLNREEVEELFEQLEDKLF